MIKQFTGDEINELISQLDKLEKENSFLRSTNDTMKVIIKDQSEVILKPRTLVLRLSDGIPMDDSIVNPQIPPEIVLEGITSLRKNPEGEVLVEFADPVQARVARAFTWWDFFDDTTLIICYDDQLNVVTESVTKMKHQYRQWGIE